MQKVSIVIPNYNGEELIKKYLPSVMLAKDNEKNCILEVIVVDDYSKDGSVNLITTHFPQVKLIRHKAHRWFSASVNTGVRTAKGNLVCLLNNDVSVSRDFLEKAILHFKDDKVFAVSLHEQGFGWANGIFDEGFIIHAPGHKDEEVHETFWVSGGSGIFKRKVWMELGGMDESLFTPFYWEDIDLSYRAAKRGYLLLWEPDSQVTHEHEGTIRKIEKQKVNLIWERNQLIFIWKNLISPNLFRKHILGLVSRTINHPGYIKVILAALLKIRQIIKARQKEKKEAKISDETIFARFK